MSEHASTPVAWREIAQLSRDCVGIQVGEVFAYATESLAAKIGITPERIVGTPPEQLLELARGSATDHAGDATASPDPELARRTVADVLETARTEGFWCGHVRAATGPGSGDITAREPGSFRVAVSVTGTGELVWRSPAVEQRGVEAGEATSPDRDTATEGGSAIPPGHRPIGGSSASGGRTATAGDSVSLGFETLDALGVAAAVLDEDRCVRSWNHRFAEATDYAPETLDGLPVEALFTETTPTIPGLLTPIPDGASGPVVGELLTVDGETRRCEFSVAPFDPPAGEGRFRCLLARNLDGDGDHSDDLATLHGITELLTETARDFLVAADRDEIERVLCSRLAESDLYRFAWVGQRAADSDRLVVRQGADEERGSSDEVPIASSNGNPGEGVAARALKTGDVQVATAAEDPTFEHWRAGVTTRGFESVAAIPLQYHETTFGILVVYTTRPDAFSDWERDAFAVLGETVGLAIHAKRNFELLRTDRVVELEFDVSVVDTVCADTALELDCNLSLEGSVPSGAGWVLYLAVDGTTPATAAERLAGDSRVDRARVVRESEQAGRLEVVVPEAPLLETVFGLGAKLKKQVASPSGSMLVLEAPKSVEVRRVVEHIQSAYPGSEFVARREHEYDGTAMGSPNGVDVLTDRQREVLEAAYRAGYYEWPRESTAEEVAESLSIAGSTFHAHLRKAEGRILSGVLDQV